MPNLNLTLARQHFLTTAMAYFGTPYRWGGDDPSGFDCSGYVLECLKSGGIVGEAEDLTADQLLTRFSRCRIGTAKSGVLQFLCDKNGHAYHVVICIDEKYQIGASGGNSAILSPADAWRQNAYIKIRPIVRAERAIFVDPFASIVSENAQEESAPSIGGRG